MESNGKYSIILKESDQSMKAEAIKILESSEFIGEYHIYDTDEETAKQIPLIHPDIVVYGLIPLMSYIESIKTKISIELYLEHLYGEGPKKKSQDNC